MTFNQLQLIDPLLRALSDEGYVTPTPVQAQAIPLILAGNDLLGCAQTGTGKTAAFALPVLQMLHALNPGEKGKKVRCLIVTPTRELAIQIHESFMAYGRYTGLKVTVVFGGVGQNPQTDALRNGVDILVATPGRLLDLMNQGFISLKDIGYFILDEADRMLDMGFIHDVRKILAALPRQRQSLFFSATMPPEVVKLSESILIKPVKVEVTPSATTAETVNQSIYFVDRENKNNLLLEILHNEKIQTILVFTRTKHGADKVVKVLDRHGVQAEAIHGNKGQTARQRALYNFKNRRTRVLVATDIASRGIDIDDMEYVLNYELPNIPETYVHRIGRTGRAGAGGTAISFCDASEKPYLKDIEKLTGIRIPVVEDHPFPLLNHNPEKPERTQGPHREPRRVQPPKPRFQSRS